MKYGARNYGLSSALFIRVQDRPYLSDDAVRAIDMPFGRRFYYRFNSA